MSGYHADASAAADQLAPWQHVMQNLGVQFSNGNLTFGPHAATGSLAHHLSGIDGPRSHRRSRRVVADRHARRRVRQRRAGRGLLSATTSRAVWVRPMSTRVCSAHPPRARVSTPAPRTRACSAISARAPYRRVRRTEPPRVRPILDIMRTKKRVDLDRLAAALPDYPFAYLITVDDGYRVHTVTVEPQLLGSTLDVGLIGGGTRENLAHRGDVTLLWPPPEPGGYSLIVDGRAEVTRCRHGLGATASGARPARCCTATLARTPPTRPKVACTTAWCSPYPPDETERPRPYSHSREPRRAPCSAVERGRCRRHQQLGSPGPLLRAAASGALPAAPSCAGQPTAQAR